MIKIIWLTPFLLMFQQSESELLSRNIYMYPLHALNPEPLMNVCWSDIPRIFSSTGRRTSVNQQWRKCFHISGFCFAEVCIIRIMVQFPSVCLSVRTSHDLKVFYVQPLHALQFYGWSDEEISRMQENLIPRTILWITNLYFKFISSNIEREKWSFNPQC